MINSVTYKNTYNRRYAQNIKPALDTKEEPSAKVKVASLLGGIAGTLGAAYFISRRQSDLLKIPKKFYNIHYSEKEIMAVAISGITGGLAAGVAFDKQKHAKAKAKDALHQTVANIVFPLVFIELANKFYSKHTIDFSKKLFDKNMNNNFLKKTAEILPNLAITLGGLISGVFAGTFVSNKINRLFDKNAQDRKLKPLDFIYHPDDLATALTLSDKTGTVQKYVSKIIPPVFSVCGYEVGTKR